MRVSVHEDLDAIREERGKGQPVYGYGTRCLAQSTW